jgi:tetratricopeptide (TPR) repeat protein
MAQQQTNPRIEELKARVRLDPKSRLFYPLAEELRKIGQFAEAERILRDGLQIHGTYLSAWISLGRVLRDTERNTEAVEVLGKALTIDPGNVVAARLAADGYLALGEKLEALKKYKLVYALLPADPEVEGLIDRLDREVNPDRYTLAPVQMSVPEFSEAPPPLDELESLREEADVLPDMPTQEAPFGAQDPVAPASDGAAVFFTGNDREEVLAEPFESADAPFGAARVAKPAYVPLAAPEGEQEFTMPEEPEPRLAETPPWSEEVPRVPEPAPLEAETPETSPFEEEPVPPAGEEPRSEHPEDALTATLTMADLYARQGYVTAAREIYERILAANPHDLAVRGKLSALPLGDAQSPEVKRREAVQRLENWLTRVGRHEGRHV